MLPSLLRMTPSAPLMLLTNTCGVPGVPAVTGILTTVSLSVLATYKMVHALSNWRPFAPNGGTPVVVSKGLVTHVVPTPPLALVFQMMPWKESETYTLPEPSNVRALRPVEAGGVG